MGLEDRDWYRDEPSKAWKSRWDTTPGQPVRGTGARTTRVHPRAWLAMVVSAGLTFVIWHWHVLPARPGTSRANAPTAPQAYVPGSVVQPQNQSNVVRLRPSPKLDTPVQRVAHWWLTDSRFGRVDVYVPVGKTPRQALTIALAARGYQVIP